MFVKFVCLLRNSIQLNNISNPVYFGLSRIVSLCQMRPQDPGQRVIALQDYTPLGDDDLPLQKDQEYTLINSSHTDWWAVQNDRG